MPCLIDGCTDARLRPVHSFVHLPGGAAKVRVRFDICESHNARFFREVEATGKAPSFQREPPTESEAVNLVRDIWAELDGEAKTMLGDSLGARVMRFLKRNAR